MILDYLNKKEAFQRLVDGIKSEQVQLVTGLTGSARSLQILSLYQKTQKPLLVVEANMLQANRLYEDLSDQLEDDALYLYTVDHLLQLESAMISPEIRGERVRVLDFLLSGKAGVVITSLAGIKRLLAPKEAFLTNCLTVDGTSEIDLDDFTQKMIDLGYIRESRVTRPGEFSVRGGVVDVFPLNETQAVRMELFDVEVDSIRYFDLESQRSIESIDSFRILPADDQFFLQSWKKQAAGQINDMLVETLENMNDEEVSRRLDQTRQDLVDALKKGESPDDLSLWAASIYPDQHNLLDYLGQDGLLILDEYQRIQENERTLTEENKIWLEEQAEAGRLPASQKVALSLSEATQRHEGAVVYYSLMERGLGNLRFDAVHRFHYRGMQQFYSQMSLLKAEVTRWLKQDYAVLVTVNQADRMNEVSDVLSSYGIDHQQCSPTRPIQNGQVQVAVAGIRSGFELPDEKLVVITEKELFNRISKKRPKRIQYSNAERLKSYNELKPGDYVVHVNHGIGRYEGIEGMDVNGTHKDYMSLTYRDGAKVFVPVDQLHLVQKYLGSEGKRPRLHKLGGTEWTKTKKKVKQQVEDISQELIQLYAEREAEKGYAFQPDNDYQKEFEDAFPYVETEDQLKSSEEIKRDMEKDRPMDRLLIGDVGYGKTEVAMRAAFKAIQEGKQVAFLVPTTVLAQQHYQSALERFEGFPVNIHLLSRFRSKKQQEETLEDLKSGRVDMIIGTHRLLSKDVSFADLGLVIVDEEQRFGVKDKERLKSLKSNVDVLTLTATPIPRTLHMSIVGVRDLSVIETPPANRYPVQTYVLEMNEDVVRHAVERELARGGQVFYLHNRVGSILQRASQLQELIPDARIAFAHGQMSESRLEEVLLSFYEQEYDVLVTTTIIETGVDMPNVNTLIVEDADRMGLSQLYQLRGRVGRSDRVAYAYLTYDAGKILKEESVQRLQVLKEFSELGSGFKIAMRDLSIRGAGDMLGKQQSGFIDSVGYEMYTQLLKEAVDEKKGQQAEEKTWLEINLDVNAYIPERYISDEFQKIEIYQRINRIESLEDVHLIQDDLIDRYGDYPQELSNLLTVALIKMYGQRVWMETIDQDKQRKKKVVSIQFAGRASQQIKGPSIFKALQDIPVQVDVKLKNDRIHVMFFFEPSMEDDIYLDYLLSFARNLAEEHEEVKEENHDEGKR